MVQNFSREQLNTIHLDSRHAGKAHEFEDWNYQIDITFRLSRGRQVPFPTSLTIETYYKDKRLDHTIIPGQNDRRRLGEFIFLLAAKLKYDLLCDIPYDEAGFLHSDEIIRLNDAGMTKVQKTTCHAIRYLIREAKKESSSQEGIFLHNFLIAPDQLLHLICYCGRTSGTKDFQDLIWWLNTHQEAVSFRDAKGNITDGQAMKKILMKLFPAECCLTDDELKAFQENIEQYPDVKWGKAKIADSAAEHIGSEGIDKTTLSPEAAGFNRALLPQITDVSAEVERHRNFVRRQKLRDIVNSYLWKHNSGYLIIEGGVGTGKTAFIVDQVHNSKKKPVVYHLIRRNMGDWDNPDAFLMSLYVQLLKKYNLPEPEGSRDMTPAVKFNRILTEVSKQLPPGDKEVIYLDGLDEAFGETGLYSHLWPRVLPQILPLGVHFIITSRPGRHLDLFASPENCVRIRIEDAPDQNDKDIKQYLKERDQTLSLGLSKKFVDVAVSRAAGNFLFAAWLIKDMKALPPKERTPKRIPDGLFERMKEEWARVMLVLKQRGLKKRQFLDTAALLTAAFEPLTASHLDELIGLDERWETAADLLDEFFEPQANHGRESRYFRFWHAAFAEFIENELGATRMREAHRRLATGCGRWPRMVASTAQNYALNYWTKHLIVAEEWEEAGRVFCNPAYLQEQITRGVYDMLLADINQCTQHLRIPDHFHRSFGALRDFLRRRSPWFHEYPKFVPQELVNELDTKGHELHSKWSPHRCDVEGPWLRKLSGPPNLTSCTHFGNVTTMKFSPDGRRIVSGGSDQSLRLWDTETLECLFVCRGHTLGVNSVAYSRDGRKIASGSDDETVRVWDAGTGECIATCKGHNICVQTVVFSPDGCKIASGDSDGMVKVWNAETGECVNNYIGHSGQVVKLAFSPNGQQLASASWDDTVRIWEGSKCIATSAKHSSHVVAVAFTANGRRVVSVTYEGKVHAWNAKTGDAACLHNKKSYSLWEGKFGWTRFNRPPPGIPNELWAFDGRILDPITGFTPFLNNTFTLAFLPRSHRLVWGGTLRIWDTNSGKHLQLNRKQGSPVASIAASPECLRVAVGYLDGSLELWDVQKGTVVARTRPPELSVSKRLAHKQFDSRVRHSFQEDRAWNFGGPPLRGRVPPGYRYRHQLLQRRLAISRDGHLLAFGDDDGKLRLWRLATGEFLARYKRHSNSITTVAFSPNGQQIASASVNGHFGIWDVATGARISTWETAPDYATAMVYSQDGSSILVSDSGGILSIFSVRTREWGKCWQAYPPSVSAVGFLAHGKRVVSAGVHGVINIWDAENGQLLYSLNRPPSPVYALTVSNTELIMAVGSADASIHLWDHEARETRGALVFDEVPVAIGFSSDDSRFFVVDGGGQFFSYELIRF